MSENQESFLSVPKLTPLKQGVADRWLIGSLSEGFSSLPASFLFAGLLTLCLALSVWAPVFGVLAAPILWAQLTGLFDDVPLSDWARQAVSSKGFLLFGAAGVFVLSIVMQLVLPPLLEERPGMDSPVLLICALLIGHALAISALLLATRLAISGASSFGGIRPSWEKLRAAANLNKACISRLVAIGSACLGGAAAAAILVHVVAGAAAGLAMFHVLCGLFGTVFSRPTAKMVDDLLLRRAEDSYHGPGY